MNSTGSIDAVGSTVGRSDNPPAAAGINRGEISVVLCPASVQHPRQTEASIACLGKGKLLLAYTDFYDGRAKDGHPARILGKRSNDAGLTWSPYFVLQDNIGKLNCMTASLLRLPSGRVLLVFLKVDSQGDEGSSSVMVRISDDDGQTWTPPRAITTERAFWAPANDRLLRLENGRILYPVQRYNPKRCSCLISDDDGQTWRHGDELAAPEGKHYEEPIVTEAGDGSLKMHIRTEMIGRRMQYMHLAKSADAGQSWTAIEQPGPTSAFTSFIVKRVPDSKDVIMIWNNNMSRTNLTAAVGTDGETWRNFRLLEAQEDSPMSRTHTYPSLTFGDGFAHMTYWESHRHPVTMNMFHLVYRRLPISWFYETQQRRAPVYDPARDLLSVTDEYDGEFTDHAVKP